MASETMPTTLGTWEIDPYHNFAQFSVKHMRRSHGDGV
jgi:polyisoprenoid-binding protein YceI